MAVLAGKLNAFAQVRKGSPLHGELGALLLACEPSLRAGARDQLGRFQPSFWTEARRAQLRRLYLTEGLSQSRVARALGCTKGAVAAELARLGIYRAAPAVDGRRAHFRAPRAAPLPTRFGATLIEVTGCRWPIGEDQGVTRFCDCRREPARPYCATHVRRAYQPRKAK